MATSAALKRMAAARNPGSWLIAGLEGAQESSGPGRNDPGWFHPSDFGNECDAYLAFRYLGAPAFGTIPARTQRIFDLGNARDEGLKRDMKKAGLSVITKESERKIVIPELSARGEIDDLVENPLSQERFIVDYKTMRPDEFENLTEAKEAHKIQVHFYMFAKKVLKAFVLYENKGNQDLKALPANWDPKFWQVKVVDRIERIRRMLGHDVVERTAGGCNRCPFNANNVCLKNDIKGLKERSGIYKPVS